MPGVVVQFDSVKSLQIGGILRAIGKPDSMITFTANNAKPVPGDWGYILFTNTSANYDYKLLTGSIMQYCIVEYAGDPNVITGNAAVRIDGSFPFIDHNIIRNNMTQGVFFYDDPNGFPNSDIIKITNCNIYNNDATSNGNVYAGGIAINVNQAACLLSYDTVRNNKGITGGIDCGSNNPNLTVSNCAILNNKGSAQGGVYLSGPGNISYNLIYGNTAPGDAGLFGGGNSQTIAFNNNIIANNNATNGTDVEFGRYGMSFFNNTVVDNTSSSETIYVGNQTYVDYNTIARNTITGVPGKIIELVTGGPLNNNNLVNDPSYYEIYNTIGQGIGNNINTKNNWWNTTSGGGIDSLIYDYLDSSGLSVVNYSPFLTSPDTTAPVTPPVNVIKTDLGGGKVKLTWIANKEADLAGYKIYSGNPTGYSFANVNDTGLVTTYTLSGISSITDTIAVTAHDSSMTDTLDQFKGHESWFTNAIGKPTVNFFASGTIICAGDTVFYHDRTVDAATWAWSFPGGTPDTSSEQNPKIIYQKGGRYTAKLIVTNIAGKDSLIKTNYVMVNTLAKTTLSPYKSICLNASPFPLTGGLPSGGTYSGTGVNDDSFFTSLAYADSFSITYTYIDTNGCGTGMASQEIKVNPLPNVNLSPFLTVCQGSGIFALYGGSPKGGAYFGLNISKDTFNPVKTGTDTIMYKYTDSNSCTAIATGTINVNPVPKVSLDTFSGVCVGGSSIFLTGGSPANGTYSGTHVRAGDFYPSVVGKDTITYSVLGNGCYGYASQTIIVNPLPNVKAGKNDTIMAGDSIQLHATGASSYSWSPATGLSNPNIANPWANPTVSTTYFITGTDANDSCSATDTLIITVNNTTGISNVNNRNASISFSPNPFSISSQMKISSTFNIVNAELDIFDCMGKEVRKIGQINSGQITIDRKDLQSGVYFCTLKNSMGIITTGKLLVQ